MKRRAFIAGLGSAAAWPVVALGQQHPKVPRIGFLGLAPEFSGVDALRAGLRDLGYVDGSSVQIGWRWAERVDQLPELAAAKPPRQFPSFSLSTLTRLGLDMRQVSLDQAGMPLDYQCSSLSLRPKNWK